MQRELDASHPDLDIQFIGVNEWGEEAKNSAMTEGRDLPWLQDVDDDGDGNSDVWTSWGVSLEDVRIVNANSELEKVYSVLFNDLGEPENYDDLRLLVVNSATSYPSDCNADGLVDAADLACVTGVGQRDAVLETLNTLPGDLDGNGDVSFKDFLTFANNFGKALHRYSDGNIDLDVRGRIDFADFLIFANNFGQTREAVATAPAPEAGDVVELDVISRDQIFEEWGQQTNDELSPTSARSFAGI